MPWTPAANALASMACLPSGLQESTSSAPSAAPRRSRLPAKRTPPEARPSASARLPLRLRSAQHREAPARHDRARRMRGARGENPSREDARRRFRREVELAFAHLLCVSGPALVLLGPRIDTALHPNKRREQSVRPEIGQLLGQIHRALASDRGRAAHAVGARVQTLLHAHDAHARLLVARQDGALDGRGAAPARQKRRVHVEASVAGQVEHGLRQDGAVGRHADDVRSERRQLALHGLVAQRARRAHGEPQALRRRLHRGRFEALAAPAHGIGARVDGDHLVLLRKILQDGRRELWRAHEHDAHRQRTRASTEVSPGRAPAAKASS